MGKSLSEAAQYMVNTSVQDMQSGLYNYSGKKPGDIEIIEHALKISRSRGEKTKVKILDAKRKRMKKEAFEVKRLQLIAEAFKEVDDASV